MHLHTGFPPCSIPKQNLVVFKIRITHLKHEKKSLPELPKTWPHAEHRHTELSSGIPVRAHTTDVHLGYFNRAKRQNLQSWLHSLTAGWKS